MFQPPSFREDRTDVMHDLMRAHPFATLVTMQDGQLCADHVPLAIHEDLSTNGTIRGHVARVNPLGRDDGGDCDALIVFQGPQAYITPSWYPSKKEHGKTVPTWNYVVVHARGTLKLVSDSDWLLDHLNELTRRHESHRPVPWEVSDAPEDFTQRMLRGIVGIELEIDSLQGTWKTSQNKDEKDRTGVERGLRLENSGAAAAVADLMEGRSG